jgi:hypothetical protein
MVLIIVGALTIIEYVFPGQLNLLTSYFDGLGQLIGVRVGS